MNTSCTACAVVRETADRIATVTLLSSLCCTVRVAVAARPRSLHYTWHKHRGMPRAPMSNGETHSMKPATYLPVQCVLLFNWLVDLLYMGACCRALRCPCSPVARLLLFLNIPFPKAMCLDFPMSMCHSVAASGAGRRQWLVHQRTTELTTLRAERYHAGPPGSNCEAIQPSHVSRSAVFKKHVCLLQQAQDPVGSATQGFSASGCQEHNSFLHHHEASCNRKG